MSRTKIGKNIAWDDVRSVYYVTLNFGKDAKACEIEAINGVVCREGRKYGVKTSINDRIVEVVKEIQEGKKQACGENVKLFDDVL